MPHPHAVFVVQRILTLPTGAQTPTLGWEPGHVGVWRLDPVTLEWVSDLSGETAQGDLRTAISDLNQEIAQRGQLERERLLEDIRRLLPHFELPTNDIPLLINTDFHGGARTRPPIARDPLVIDLDGDGIETVGSAVNPILFDHNADGVRSGTGWVRSDDAWLVLDRNGNGLIDTGRELFGVDTVLSGTPGVDAVYASTGFQALKQLDANNDNVFNASDSGFTEVRLWRDLNQDGVSQGGELFTLASYNIASIALNASTTNINLGNGNTVSGTAVVTRGNGSTTLAETVSVSADTAAANLNLTNNPFYRQFTTPVVLTTEAQALPEMGGSGWVRDLREAMSLGTPQAAALAAKVQEFKAASTRDAQMALLDDLLRLWAETNQTRAVGVAMLAAANQGAWRKAA